MGGSSVLVGMSGGVDSAAAARLLLDAGYAVAGATFLFCGEGSGADCGDAARDAAGICSQLGIEHFVLDERAAFLERVINPFVDSYIEGLTPNPCIECNRSVKIPSLLRAADSKGFDLIATGHYARAKRCDDGRFLLLKGKDCRKDQSYVLYTLTQDALSRILFPLGGLTKDEARSVASAAGLAKVAAKAESQDICFIPAGDYAAFIRERRPDALKAGDFVLADGSVVGRHRGYPCYTIGQRRGIACALGKPMYVTAKDPLANTVTLGSDDELYSDELVAERVNLISKEKIESGARALVKTRYSQAESPAALYPEGEAVRVVFDAPQRALTEGQSAVFYEGEAVIGGGIIARVIR